MASARKMEDWGQIGRAVLQSACLRAERKDLWRDIDTVTVAGIDIIVSRMTQEERWLKRYWEVMGVVEGKQRNPSRHRLEEHDMLNWLKSNRKKMKGGGMKEPRWSRFKELLVLAEEAV